MVSLLLSGWNVRRSGSVDGGPSDSTKAGYTVTFRLGLMDGPGLRGDDMRRDSLHDDVDLGGVSVLVVDNYEPLRVGVVAMLEGRRAFVASRSCSYSRTCASGSQS